MHVGHVQAYWDWSVDEMATYDLPAMLSLVTSVSLQKVHYIGYSQVKALQMPSKNAQVKQQQIA
jgi:hypothetical protein